MDNTTIKGSKVDIPSNFQLLPPPAPPGKKYRSYQIEAILLARKMKNILIADEMGLGKTISAIGIINDIKQIRKVLIVCPATLRINWVREILSWLAGKQLTVGIATTRRWSYADIVITNYEALKPLHRNIHSTKWDLLIVDEAHALKNVAAKRTTEIIGSRHRDPMKRRPKLEADRKIFLTGTPIVNRPYELWPLINYLAPEHYSDRQGFINQYCGGKKGGQKLKEIGEKNLRSLYNRLTSTIMIRRRKKDVLTELPEKTRHVIVMPTDKLKGAISREQQAFRQIQEKLSVARMRAELAKTDPSDEVYEREVKALRQIEFSSIQQITALRFQTALAKIPLVVEYTTEILEQVPKLVIFAHHTAVIENIANEFGEAVVTVTGKVNHIERQKRIDLFQSDPECRLFIGSLKAAGEGITLTAAQIILFAEQDWTPAAMDQAESRVHRMGQRGNVQIIHLVLDKSIDAVLAHRIIEKQETISAAIDPISDTQSSLYSLSQASPFVEEGRAEILEIASRLSNEEINQIHDALESESLRGRRPAVPAMDFSLIQLLAKQEYLEPTQAALGLALLRKHNAPKTR